MDKQKVNNWDSRKRNKLFKLVFLIPAGLWLSLCLLAMIPDPSYTDPLTWGDFILANTFIISFWFAVSFIITHIVSLIMKKYIKNIEENKYENEIKEKMIVQNNIIEDKPETKRKDNKCLYTCESIVDAYEYKIMAKYFPKRMYWVFVLRGTFLTILLSLVFAFIFKSFISTIIFFILFEIFGMLIYKFRLGYFAEKTFNSYLKRGIVDTNLETEFYEDYFIRKGKTASLIIKYSDITRIVENDTNFYLEYPQKNTVIIIQKNRCDLELISFIREKFNNVENVVENSSKFKGTKTYHNPKFIKYGMIILFVITILSLYAAILTFALVAFSTDSNVFNFTKNAWVIWLWLPIAILSIVLGIKYKKAGFKCTKNIVAGFIVAFLLLAYGSFYFFPTHEEDYNKIYEYQDIIGIELPNNGSLKIQEFGTYFEEDKTENIIINAYYKDDAVTNFEKEIENNNNWILSNDMKSILKIYIPFNVILYQNSYVSIYNKTNNEYNKIPTKSGSYEIYTMIYDMKNNKLEIYKYNYSYK